MRRHLILAAALAVLAIAPALAQPPQDSADHETRSLQGGDVARMWANDPHMHAFYELTKATLAGGVAGIDFAAYREKAYAIFRDFAPTMHMTPDQMVDHLRIIPQQMVDIVRENPKTIASYDNFVLALMGPQ